MRLCELITKVAHIGFVGACVTVAYRRANELQLVEDGRDGDGVMHYRPASPVECADSAIEYGTCLAAKFGGKIAEVWKS